MRAGKTIVVLPAYNEAKVIGQVIKDIRKEGFKDIIVIDDCSSDRTAEIAGKAGADVYSLPVNMGVGTASLTGIDAAEERNAAIIVTLDADGQHDVKDIRKVIAPILDGKADIVIGSRLINPPKGMPWIRKVGNFGLNLLTFFVAGKWFSDTQSGFRAYRKGVMPKLDLAGRTYEICSEILVDAARKRMRIIEVPIRVIYTKYSLSKGQSVTKGFITFLRLLRSRLFR